MNKWVVWVIIITIFLTSAVSAFIFDDNPTIALLIPVILSGIGIVYLFLTNPFLGLAALLISTQIDFTLAGRFHITFILLVVLISLMFIDIVFQKVKPVQFSSPTIIPLIAFCLVTIVSFGLGQLPWFLFTNAAPYESQIAGLALFILSAGAFLLVAYQIKDIKYLRWLTWTLVFVCGFTLIFRLVGPSGRIVLDLLPPGSNGPMLLTWLAAMAISQALFNRDLDIKWKIILIAVTLGHLYLNITSNYDWKSGWIPPLIAIGTLVLLRFPKLSPLLILFSLPFLINTTNSIIASDIYSVDTRIEAWKIILTNIVSVNPIFGLGPSNYRFYTHLFPILGWEVQFNSHNNYIDIIAQTGLIGLFCFFWFFFEVGRLSWRVRQKIRDGFSYAYVNGVLGGLIGTVAAGMLGDWIIPFIYNVGIPGFRTSIIGWVFLGGVVSIEQIMRYKGENQ